MKSSERGKEVVMDFETKIIPTQQSCEIELKWFHKDDLKFLLDSMQARVVWCSIDELCKQCVEVALNVNLFWTFRRLIQKFEDMLDC